MTERPRLTVQVIVNSDGSNEVLLSLNPAARERLISELNMLDQRDDHFHLFNYDWVGDGFQLSPFPYHEGDKLAGHLKVLLRPDDWDAKYYPHVMAEPPPDPV